jgi:hypothetical protein
MRARTFAAALGALLALASAAPARAQAPARYWSGPPRLVDAGRMRDIEFAETAVRWKGPRPGKVVEANVYPPGILTPLYPTVPIPPAPEAVNADRWAAEAAEATNAFGYTLASDVSVLALAQSGAVPADCHMAAGFGHVVATINTQLAIYDKEGRLTYHTTLDSLLGTAPGWSGCFDPKVRFDAVRNRYYVVALDRHGSLARSCYRLACSVGPDPTQGWHVWELRNELNGMGIDYEELGFGPRGMYLTGNYFQYGGWPPPTMGTRGSCWVLDLAAIVTGSNFSFYRFDDLRGTENEVITTAKTPGSGVASAPGIDAITLGVGNAPNSAVRRALFWGWSLPANFPDAAPTAVQQHVEIAQSNPIPNAPQRGGPAQLQANNLGGPFLGASIANGRIVAAMPVEASGAVNVRAYEFDVSTWPTVSITHTADLNGAPATSHYWPNTARNEFGEQALVWSQSSSAEFVGSRWGIRQRDQATYPQEGPVEDGFDYYGLAGDIPGSLYRWGDYAGIDVDPVGQGFWFFDSYASFGGAFGTRLVHVPHVEYVDNTVPSSSFGTRANPRTQLADAFLVARPGNEVVIKASTYSVPANYTVNLPLRIVPDGGTVTIVAP